MPFLSYAQNFEDVMLWRALGRVTHGFYIDVGSQHPDIDSVTRAFYDRGWSGVNIEPVPAFIELLRAARPRDLNLGVALGKGTGEAILHIVEGSGLSTMDPMVAAHYAAEGQSIYQALVRVRTLAEVCRDHAPCEIHFIKIDVEHYEREVLAGADFVTYRPWILVIESTRPNSRELSFAAWEHLVIGAAYRFVWFDGLNRFYVATEHYDEFARHFETPPNVFDDFLQVNQYRWDRQITEARLQAAEALGRAAAAQERAERLQELLLRRRGLRTLRRRTLRT
jgi:FkbM family methyltransferase